MCCSALLPWRDVHIDSLVMPYAGRRALGSILAAVLGVSEESRDLEGDFH